MTSEPLNFRAANQGDFTAIAELITAQCRNPATQCIQSSTGESAANLVEEMEKWHASDEMAWVMAESDRGLAGVMGAEFDREMGRAWLRGPFALDNFHENAGRLWDLLMQSLPTEIVRFDSFLNAQNRRGQAFYADAGFEEKGRAHAYAATRSDFDRIDRSRIPGHVVQLLALKHHDSFAALHDATFPGTFYYGRQIIEKLDAVHRVWVHAADSEVLGYLFGVVEPWAAEGYVEFLGVSEKARGRGIGGALLLAAMDWFFNENQLPGAGLTVDDENANARSLYERVGFRLKYTGVNQRLASPKSS